MNFQVETRLSDSPYVETMMQGQTVASGFTIRPAASQWHMVFTHFNDKVYATLVGPWTSVGVVSFAEGAEILWVKFKLGVFMPHLPTRHFLDSETQLTGASHNAFWLHSTTWELPDFENADTFINRLVRQEMLVYDPVVNAVLQNEAPAYAPRTLRHRFLHATGLTQKHIQQVERAQQAELLLRQGVPILDTVDRLGFYDQSHLNRALRQWIGYTPAQLLQAAAVT